MTVPLRQVALALLLAWLPSLAYVGHWEALVAPLTGAAVATHAHASSGAEHESHCHANLDGCSGSSAASVPVGGLPLVTIPAPAAESGERVGANERRPLSLAMVPSTPPPRMAA